MIPILYESNEVSFTSNGMGRLRDCLSCTVYEQRNGVFECDFEYPVTGANFDLIQPGRIVAVWHDDTGDVQPFDIVSYSKPIDGVVSFHAVHISYRLTGVTVAGKNINSLADAFDLFASASGNQFTYTADFSSSAYMAAADGTPRTVRQMLGGIEGSVLDTYGGEYEFNRFQVNLYRARGQVRDFSIRYGVNLLDYTEETDYTGTYSAVIPFWTGQNAKGVDTVVVGNKVDSGLSTYNGREICVPLDLTEKFETIPTKAQLQNLAAALMTAGQPNLPQQTITVDFIRLQDTEEYAGIQSLLQCRLCDSVGVVFPDYNMQGQFKIVSTTYDVLMERYTQMELGSLSTSLAEALGVSSGGTFTEGIEPSMDADTIAATLLTGGYFTEHFEGTRGSSVSNGYCYGGYDPLTGMVVVAFTAKNSSVLATSTDLYTVPEKYRPQATRRGVLLYGISSGNPVNAGYCTINTSGGIRQGNSNNFTLGVGVIAYGVNEA